MVLSGNSTQANGSRTNSVVALSGKEQISPMLLLSDNAPDNPSEMEQSCMVRTSLRNRKKPSLSVDKPSNGFAEKTLADVKSFVAGNHPNSALAEDSTYISLVDFLSKTPPDPLPGKNGISTVWTCNECCQTFLSSTELQVHMSSHKVTPTLGNQVKSVIESNKKRQSPVEITISKRLKRSTSPESNFVFNAASMQHTGNSGEKFYKCDICEHEYATSDVTGFKVHYLRSHINYQFISSSDRVLCSIVDDGLKSKVTDHLYRCYYCNVSCADKKLLIEHNAEHKSNVFRCQYCHAVFYQNKAFTNHVKNCTKSPRAHTVNYKLPISFVKPPPPLPPAMTLCLFCKDLTYFTDRDVHTRDYHCYSNGIIRIECVYGCSLKPQNLHALYKHYNTVHKDVYFSCPLCKVRFVSADMLRTHNRAKHNSDTGADKKQTLVVTKTDKKPGSQSVVKPNGQLVVKSGGPSLAKTNGQVVVKPSSPPVSSPKRHLQDIIFKSILKIDLIEQVNVLKKHAALYPDIVKLPQHPVFASSAQDSSCPHCPPNEEEYQHPVFSSSEENNIYICKTCGLQTEKRETLTDHMTASHPYIHNDYLVFSKEDLPQDLWSLCQPPDVKGKPNATARRNLFTCTSCAFECRETAEFHRHLLQCVKKHKTVAEVPKTKTEAVRKEDTSRRRMVITGVLREVPDDPLFSYKKELEKTIRKPGDSETVFNMLNKLPSKRLVKTTERYDSLYYKNNKAMKPKRSSLERLTQALNERDMCYSLSDYLKHFTNQESQKDDMVEESALTPAVSCEPAATGEIGKVVLEKKPKVARAASSCSEESGDKKVKTKSYQGQPKERVGEKRVKSPKLVGGEENKMNGDGKKCKVSGEEKKAKVVKPNGACEAARKISPSQVGDRKRKLSETETNVMENMACKGLPKVKIVQLHYPTVNIKSGNTKTSTFPMLNLKAQHKMMNATFNTKKTSKNILVEKKGKNLNPAVKRKGKHHLDGKKKMLTKKNAKSKNRNLAVKGEAKKSNCDKPNETMTQPRREVSPRRKKKTTRIVVVSDEPLLPLLTKKK